MKSYFSRLLATLLLSVLLVSCGEKELAEEEVNAWDATLVAIGGMMERQESPDVMIEHIHSAAKDADTVFPYLESVMASDAGEKKKSAALMVFGSAYMLINTSTLKVPDKAYDHVMATEGHSAAAAPLLENQDLVPTYKAYNHTIDK